MSDHGERRSHPKTSLEPAEPFYGFDPLPRRAAAFSNALIGELRAEKMV